LAKKRVCFSYSPKALEAHEVQVLLAGGDPAGAQVAPAWRRVDLEVIATAG